MYELVGSLLITAVAVTGTLIASTLAQRQAARTMSQEMERLERWRVMERREQARRTDRETHRAGYTALNTAARRYLAALTNQLHALRLGSDVEQTTTELMRARAAHADCYAEIQLIAPEGVLEAARTANHALNHVFGMLMRLTHGTPSPDDDLAAAQAGITDLWASGLALLRRRMRQDLDLDRDTTGTR